MKLLIMLFSISIIIGCTSTDIRYMGEYDPNEKTITLPPGGGPFLGYLKEELIKSGWELFVYQGPEITEKNQNKNIQYDTFKSRYTLIGAYLLSTRWTSNDFVQYDYSLIDNHSGREIITFTGNAYVGTVISKMLEVLNP